MEIYCGYWHTNQVLFTRSPAVFSKLHVRIDMLFNKSKNAELQLFHNTFNKQSLEKKKSSMKSCSQGKWLCKLNQAELC